MRLVIIWVMLFLISGVARASEDDPAYGPIVTFADKEMSQVTIFYFTDDKEKGCIFISNDMTNYTEIEPKRTKYHEFEIEAADLSFIYYKIISTTREIKGSSGLIRLPNYKSYTVAAYGNTLSSFDIQKAMSYQIAQYQPALVFHSGNMIEDTYSYWMYEQFFSSGALLLSSTPIIPVIGTSDFYNSIWKRTFDVSNSREAFYSYHLPLMDVIVLNSSSYYGEDSVQYRWLLEELSEVDPDDWLVIAMHRSPFKQSDPNEYFITGKFDHLMSVFEDYGVDVVFTGNLFLYERSETNGITFINCGGAFENMFGTSYNNSARKAITTGENFYVIMDVNDNYLDIKAYDLTGNILDSVEIFK